MLKRSRRVAHLLLHRVLMLGLGLAGFAALGTGALAFRLSREPMQLGWAVRPIQAALKEDGQGWQVKTASLAWEGWRQGHNHPLRLELGGLMLRDGGQTLVSAEHAGLSLWLPQLLLGHIAPRRLWISGGSVLLRRDKDGSITLDRPSHAVQPPGETANGFKPARLRYLRSVEVQGSVALVDEATGTRWLIPDLNVAMARQRNGSLSGQAHATLRGDGDNGAPITEMRIVAVPTSNGETIAQAALTPVDTGWLADHIPSLSFLHAVQSRVGGSISVTLNPALAPVSHRMTANLGPGKLVIGPTVIGLHDASVSLNSTKDGEAISPSWISIVSPDYSAGGSGKPITLGLTGTIVKTPAGRDIALQASLDRLNMADLPQLWPPTVQADTRAWVTGNITDGVVHDGAAKIALHGDADFSNLSATAVTASLLGDGLAVHWMRPVPPMTEGKAVLTLRTKDILDIAVSSAHQGKLSLHDGWVHITGVSQRDQDLTLHAVAEGAAADAIALLRHPRLGLLSKHPIALKDARGSVETAIDIGLPLKKKLTIEEVAIRVHAILSDMHISEVAMQRDLDEGQVTLDATNAGLKMNGTAQLAGLPSHLEGGMNFVGNDPMQVWETLGLDTQGSVAQMREAGFDMGVMQGGNASIHLTYAGRRDDEAEAKVHVDLGDAVLGSDLLGWHKGLGTPGTIAADFHLTNDHLAAIPSLQADAKGLRIRAHGSTPNELILNEAKIGGTDTHGRMDWGEGDAPLHFTLSGPILDLASWLHGSGTKTAKPDKNAPTIILDGAFDRLRLGGPPIEGVRFHLQQEQGAVHALQADTNTPHGTLRISSGNGERPLHASFDDAGSLAHAVGVLSGLQGGQLRIDGRYDDTDINHPLLGSLVAEHFREQAPLIVKLAEAMTVYGAPAAVAGDGLAINRLTMSFKLDGSRLQLDDAKLFNQAIGATASGWIDLAAANLDLSGTIVPAYFFNTLLGHLPVIGSLIGPGPGRGVFETSFTMRGPVGSPKVNVNPLSTLAPRVLNGVLKK